MKNMKNLIGVLCVVATLGACSKWAQDPMEGQPWPNKTGKPSPGGEKPRPGNSSDNIRIDSEPKYLFEEETSTSYEISARVLLPGYSTPVISIKNLSEFENATFDSATGIFKWTPPFGTTVGADVLFKDIIIRVVTSKLGEFDEVRDETRPVVVKRLNKSPTIKSVSKPNTIREGEKKIVQVVVKDLSATTDTSTWPRLVMVPDNYNNSLSGFATIRYPSMKSINEFEFEVEVDLSGKELTNSSEYFHSSFVAYSQNGLSSRPESFYMRVLTSFSDLSSTWWNEVPVVAKKLTTYNFVIFDPKNEVELNNPVFNKLPAGASVKCEKRSDSISRQYCQFEWTPNEGTKEEFFSIYAEIEVQNRDLTYDTETEVKELSFPIRVMPQDSPSQAQAKEF